MLSYKSIMIGNFALMLLLILSFFCNQAHSDTGMTESELEKWFNEDDIEPVQVDEGELVFLSGAPEKAVLHSVNELTITQDSITSGWLGLSQCYKHLDPIARTVVVYKYKFMKNLRIVSTANIEKAEIKQQNIELENVLANAQFCIKAQVKIFDQISDGTYSLITGPYHRKFLDGYFPYHVTLSIAYPGTLLKVLRTYPEPQKGFAVQSEDNKIIFDSVFAGKLTIEAVFEKR